MTLFINDPIISSYKCVFLHKFIDMPGNTNMFQIILCRNICLSGADVYEDFFLFITNMDFFLKPLGKIIYPIVLNVQCSPWFKSIYYHWTHSLHISGEAFIRGSARKLFIKMDWVWRIWKQFWICFWLNILCKNNLWLEDE